MKSKEGGKLRWQLSIMMTSLSSLLISNPRNLADNLLFFASQDDVAKAEPRIDEYTAKLVAKGRWAVPGYKVRRLPFLLFSISLRLLTSPFLDSLPLSAFLPPFRYLVSSNPYFQQSAVPFVSLASWKKEKKRLEMAY